MGPIYIPLDFSFKKNLFFFNALENKKEGEDPELSISIQQLQQIYILFFIQKNK